MEDITAYLQGHVFHVTKLEYLPSIEKCGEIRANRNGTFPSTFAHRPNGFFRKRDCVSLFDYRTEPNEQIRDFRGRCNPFRPAFPPNGPIAILVLAPTAYKNLIPSTALAEERAFDEIVVPHVETGYPRAIPLTLITEIIKIEITENPQSLAALLRKVHQ